MSPSADRPAWRRLGELLTRRRVELDSRYQNRTIFAAERGLDYRLAFDIEEAKRANFRTTTLTAIAAAYGVTTDSLFAVLRDGADRLEPVMGAQPDIQRPVPVPSPAEDEPDDSAWKLFPNSPEKRAIWRLHDGDGRPLPERVRAELIAALDEAVAEMQAEVRGEAERGKRATGLGVPLSPPEVSPPLTQHAA